MSTCWIDLTDLAHWKGHMTGIQRTVYYLAKYYSENNAAKFFIFDPLVGFNEVDFKTIDDRITAPIKVAEEVDQQKRKAILAAKMLYAHNKPLLLRGLKYAFRRSPQNIQKTAIAVYKRRHYDPAGTSEVLQNIIHPFGKGDVILLPGASWHKDSVIINLGQLKLRHELKIVHVVYDMIPELFPQFFGIGFGAIYTRHMLNAIAISDHLLAISENTKRDTIAFMDKLLQPKVPVSTFRLGDSPTYAASEKTPDNRVRAGEYILAVGTQEVRKNYQLLYYVWRKAAAEGKPLPTLVIVGQAGWLSYDIGHLMRFDPLVSDSIVILNNISDSDVAWLYKNCMFSVYPSWYEGWGLPIAESLNYGKLCIASKTSSMTEIAGSLIEYIDPYDVVGTLELVRKYATDKTRLEAVESKIKQQYKKVGWKQAYEDCRSITSSLLSR